MRYLLVFTFACHTPRATPQLCTRVLERLVDLELHERGYRDPHLLETHTADMKKKFADRLKACEGRPVSAQAHTCIENARTTEELVHTCLR